MTSTSMSNMIKRKRDKVPEVKVAVLGAPYVGKSAITVRFITRRYIVEYDHKQADRYRHEMQLDGESLICEVLDTCTKRMDDLPSAEILQWADALFLVYSITDRESFNYLKNAKKYLTEMPMTLVGNKADMVHLRQISMEEGEILAKNLECSFVEVTAADQVEEIHQVFYDLCREVMSQRPRAKHSLLERMLGNNRTPSRTYSRGKSDSALPKD